MLDIKVDLLPLSASIPIRGSWKHDDLMCDFWPLRSSSVLCHEDKSRGEENQEGDDDSLKIRHGEEH